MTPEFTKLLDEVRASFAAHQSLREFCDFPADLSEQPVEPYFIPAARLMEEDGDLFSPDHTALRDAVIAASPVAQWRETYSGTRIAELFRERFACYCFIGNGGPYTAPDMGAYFVYMPAGLYYPFHHHPAEELYFIIAGEAEFMLEGSAPKTLGPGEHVFHPSMRPHATQTHDHPFLALVLWRGDMSVTPVLTNPEDEP